ncbi:MAG TPA: NADH-quinone oxidoreductase subunit NuoG [Candidatus Acidoferrales bacterium]|nr:NADH-quinone oxidoreductase subunit NuoG [Candidatus Acidoferrales bacterium]
MATVYVDNQAYEMDPQQNLLHACLQLGMDLPYFCWHPAMGSVGACRQCAVKQFKDEKDQHGRIVMACMTPAAEGARISVSDPEAVEFRKAIIEGLMLNHPHDCPVCDEGGECHLQDMTVMTGHDYRRYGFEKRTFRNQYLGPFVNHEMNRCIQCYRCVRFYREYAGGNDLNAFALRNVVFFGRDRDGVLENEFAGNLVEVCPTGVFTDATLKHHYTRKWDLQMAPSICVHCALGCNITAAERYGMLRRLVNRYNGEVNGYFLCDRGRFGYEFVNSGRRVRKPRLHGKPAGAEEALGRLRELAAGSAIGIGSPRASLESNFALRSLVGADRFYAGIRGAESRLLKLMLDIIRGGPARTPSLREIEASDAVLILGEDVTNVAPRMALSLRQSIRQQPMQIAERMRIPLWMDHSIREALQERKGPLFVAAASATRLDDIATRTMRGAPDDVARLGFCVAHALDAGAAAPADVADPIRSLAAEIAAALKSAKRPLIVSGPTLGSAGIIQAAANVAWALPGAALAFLAPESNSIGLALMDAPPLDAALATQADAVLILENDLYRRLPTTTADDFLARFRHVAVLDCLENRTTERAELLLPSATFAEADGSLVSSEGRTQRFLRAFAPEPPVQESWRWLGSWQTLDDILAALTSALPHLAAVSRAAPPESFRMAGAKIPREPHRYSGRTAMLANITVHEPKPPGDPDSPLAFSMEGSPDQPPAALQPFFWTPGWNSIQAVNKFQEEIGGPLRGGNPGVRILEPNGSRPPFFAEAPAAFQARAEKWLLIPVHHIFGSEELSRFAPGIAQLSPEPYVALNPEDAAAFGSEAELLGHRLPVTTARDLPRGLAGVPAGIPPFEGLDLPMWSRISRPS